MDRCGKALQICRTHHEMTSRHVDGTRIPDAIGEFICLSPHVIFVEERMLNSVVRCLDLRCVGTVATYLLATAFFCTEISSQARADNLDALYQQILRHPGNPELNLQFAQLAEEGTCAGRSPPTNG